MTLALSNLKDYSAVGSVGRPPLSAAAQLVARRLGVGDGYLWASVEALEEIAASERACASCRGLEGCGAPARHRATVGCCDSGGYVLTVHRVCKYGEALARQEQVAGLLRSSRLPGKTAHMTLDTYRPEPGTQEALELARAVADFAKVPGGGRGLILSGPWGVGKTHLAVGILWAWLDAGRVGVFATVPDLMADLRTAQFSDERGHGSDLLNILRDAELLVLDDLGVEKPSEWVLETLFRLVNGRELENTVTVVTTNAATPAELGARLDGRILSRLVGMCEWVKLTGTDHRMLA